MMEAGGKQRIEFMEEKSVRQRAYKSGNVKWKARRKRGTRDRVGVWFVAV